MPNSDENIPQFYGKAKNSISFIFSYFILIYGIFNLVVTLLATESNTFYINIFLTIVGITLVLLLHLKKFDFAFYFLIYGGVIGVIYGSFLVQSASTLSLISILIIIPASFGNIKTSSLIFFLSMVYVSLMVFLRKFTISQTIIKPYNIALVNNVQVIIGLLPASFIIGYLIYRVLYKTIHSQQEQYHQLQDAQALIASQTQLESIRLVSGGLAHDLNNFFTIFSGYLSLLKNQEFTQDEFLRIIGELEIATTRASNLSDQLLYLAKPIQKKQEKVLFVNDLIKNTSTIALKGRKSGINYDLDPDSFEIIADYNQISQVIQNLILNADSSMKKPGFITVKKKNVFLDQNNEFSLDSGNYIRIDVIDEGEGIFEENKGKIFNIFFTTKEHGSGIGLSISKKIVEDHKGFIGFTSELRKGSDFFFLLPSEELKNVPNVENQNLSSFKLEKDHIAVIYDDNEDIIKILSILLEKFGIKSFSAYTSKDIIKIVDQLPENANKPVLFFIDLTIPGDLSGNHIIKILKNKIENGYYIISSGYSDSEILNNYQNFGFDNV